MIKTNLSSKTRSRLINTNLSPKGNNVDTGKYCKLFLEKIGSFTYNFLMKIENFLIYFSDKKYKPYNFFRQNYKFFDDTQSIKSHTHLRNLLNYDNHS